MSCIITLANPELWEILAPLPEVSVTKAGRRTRPPMKYNVSGLDPSTVYTAKMKLEKVDDFIRMFDTSSNSWIKKYPSGIQTEDQLVDHDAGSKEGKEWMDSGIDFSDLMFSRVKNETVTMNLVVEPDHLYQPIVLLSSEARCFIFLDIRQQFVATNRIPDARQTAHRKLRYKMQWMNRVLAKYQPRVKKTEKSEEESPSAEVQERCNEVEKTTKSDSSETTPVKSTPRFDFTNISSFF